MNDHDPSLTPKAVRRLGELGRERIARAISEGRSWLLVVDGVVARDLHHPRAITKNRMAAVHWTVWPFLLGLASLKKGCDHV